MQPNNIAEHETFEHILDAIYNDQKSKNYVTNYFCKNKTWDENFLFSLYHRAAYHVKKASATTFRAGRIKRLPIDLFINYLTQTEKNDSGQLIYTEDKFLFFLIFGENEAILGHTITDNQPEDNHTDTQNNTNNEDFLFDSNFNFQSLENPEINPQVNPGQEKINNTNLPEIEDDVFSTLYKELFRAENFINPTEESNNTNLPEVKNHDFDFFDEEFAVLHKENNNTEENDDFLDYFKPN